MDYPEHLIKKAIENGDMFSANLRDKSSFYYSYNYTLNELASMLQVSNQGELTY